VSELATTSVARSPGAVFLQILRPTNTDSDVFISFAAGALRKAGLPVRRARITLTHDQLLSFPRTVPAELRERLERFLLRGPASTVVVNSVLYDDLVPLLEAVLPGVRIISMDAGLPLLSNDQLVAFVRNGRRPLTYRTSSELMEEFYEAFYEGAIDPLFEVEDLTPDVVRRGIEGDLFLDYICYYRKPYQDGEYPALEGSSSCTFCTMPQLRTRPRPPAFERFIAHLTACKQFDPSMRVFHVNDAAFSQHAEALAEHLLRSPFEGLELCVSQRVPDVLRHRRSLERGLALLATKKHTVHFFLLGFESFSERELSRFNKGYPALLNAEAVVYLRELRQRFGEAFAYAGWSSHGFINFTPWSTIDDLQRNLFFVFALDFVELSTHFYLRKLRLYPSLPLYKLAEADGLLQEEFEDPRQRVSHWLAYPREVAWRFADPRAAAVSRWTTRMFLPSRDDEETLLRPFALALGSAWPKYVEPSVVLYAAIVHAFGRGGLPPDADDARVLEAIYRAMQLPLTELFADEGPALSARPVEIAADPELTDHRTFRLHVALLEAGLKRVLKWECAPSGEEARAAVTALEARGLRTLEYALTRCHGPFSVAAPGEPVVQRIVLAARDAAVLEEFRSAHVREMARDAAATDRIGALLGYPPCCVAAFRARVRDNERTEDDLALFASIVAGSGAPISEHEAVFHRDAMVEYTPCRLGCEATRQRIERLGQHDPSLCSSTPARPSLYLDPRCWFELEGVEQTFSGLRYRGVQLVGDAKTAGALLEALRGADRLVLLPHLLLLFRDEHPVGYVAHPGLVPFTFGLPNNFGWLDHARGFAGLVLPPVDFDALVRASAGRADGVLTKRLGLSIASAEVAEPADEIATEPAPSPRAASWLEVLTTRLRPGKRFKNGVVVNRVWASGDSVLISASDGPGECQIVCEPNAEGRAGFARSEHVCVWYRTLEGATLTPALAAMCRGVLTLLEEPGDGGAHP